VNFFLAQALGQLFAALLPPILVELVDEKRHTYAGERRNLSVSVPHQAQQRHEQSAVDAPAQRGCDLRELSATVGMARSRASSTPPLRTLEQRRRALDARARSTRIRRHPLVQRETSTDGLSA